MKLEKQPISHRGSPSPSPGRVNPLTINTQISKLDISLQPMTSFTKLDKGKKRNLQKIEAGLLTDPEMSTLLKIKQIQIYANKNFQQEGDWP